MTRKTKNLYLAVFTKLCDLVLEFTVELQFSYISTDFEMAAIMAFKEVFPEAKVRGCHFHFAQSIIRKVAEFGKKTLYNSNDAVANQVRQLIALANVPADQIPRYYDSIKADIDDQLLDILKYVEVIN